MSKQSEQLKISCNLEFCEHKVTDTWITAILCTYVYSIFLQLKHLTIFQHHDSVTVLNACLIINDGHSLNKFTNSVDGWKCIPIRADVERQSGTLLANSSTYYQMYFGVLFFYLALWMSGRWSPQSL